MSKVHEIDGKKYVEVERKAEVGEKIVGLYTESVNEVIEVEENGRAYGYNGYCAHRQNYRVLEPLYTCDKCKTALGDIACSNSKGGSYCSAKCADADEPKTEETPAPDLVDLIANLSAEVTQLKRNHAEQIDTLFRNVQQLGEELATMQTVEDAQAVDNTPVTLPKWIVDRLMGGYRG